MINKSDSRFRSSDFVNHSYDYKPNWTLLSPITIIYRAIVVKLIDTVEPRFNKVPVADPVFLITFKGRVSTKSFEGSIAVGLPTSSQVSHLFCRVRWPAFSGFTFVI